MFCSRSQFCHTTNFSPGPALWKCLRAMKFCSWRSPVIHRNLVHINHTSFTKTTKRSAGCPWFHSTSQNWPYCVCPGETAVKTCHCEGSYSVLAQTQCSPRTTPPFCAQLFSCSTASLFWTIHTKFETSFYRRQIAVLPQIELGGRGTVDFPRHMEKYDFSLPDLVFQSPLSQECPVGLSGVKLGVKEPSHCAIVSGVDANLLHSAGDISLKCPAIGLSAVLSLYPDGGCKGSIGQLAGSGTETICKLMGSWNGTVIAESIGQVWSSTNLNTAFLQFSAYFCLSVLFQCCMEETHMMVCMVTTHVVNLLLLVMWVPINTNWYSVAKWIHIPAWIWCSIGYAGVRCEICGSSGYARCPLWGRLETWDSKAFEPVATPSNANVPIVDSHSWCSGVLQSKEFFQQGRLSCKIDIFQNSLQSKNWI